MRRINKSWNFLPRGDGDEIEDKCVENGDHMIVPFLLLFLSY
jgi:hypothetical protein